MNTTELQPVQISPDARVELARKLREWSGWDDASLTIGVPQVSPYASVNRKTRQFTINVDALSLNPNRVLRSVSPFRLRQEAVLTGAMLHEAGHARFTTWAPLDQEGRDALKHWDGTPVAPLTLSFAKVFEEARVEGNMALSIWRGEIPSATGLDWTMRASATHLLPLSEVDTNPDQDLLNTITSWALRAGRRAALRNALVLANGGRMQIEAWEVTFLNLLLDRLRDHAKEKVPSMDPYAVLHMIERLTFAAPYEMLDQSRAILERLFPETDQREDLNISAGCEGHDDTESESTGGGGSGEPSPLQQVEAEAQAAGEQEADKASVEQVVTATDPKMPARLAGSGRNARKLHIAAPTKADREEQARAERFLRRLIDLSESRKTVVGESPSASIDPASMAAWKASGQTREPVFFRRTSRTIAPTPPIQIAILVDVSSSMDVLQKPASLLSWSLAAAAQDLRNFAGAGRRVETCLIHWGATARVIQPNGGTLPGIVSSACREGTASMGAALRLADEQMPGFLSPTEKPVNRLLVQFTDWELFGTDEASPAVTAALRSGVNMLSVMPPNGMYSALGTILTLAGPTPGKSHVVTYDHENPGQLWDTAAQILNGH